MNEAEQLGAELRTARLARDLPVPQIEKVLKIRAKFIEAMEEGRFEALPSIPHARGFLEVYARHLGLNAASFVQWFDSIHNQNGKETRSGKHRTTQSLPIQAVNVDSDDVEPVKQLARRRTTPAPRYDDQPERRGSRLSRFATVLIGLVALVILGGVAFFSIGGTSLLQGSGDRGDVPFDTLPTLVTPTFTPSATVPIRPSPLPNLRATLPPNPTSIAVQLEITARGWLRVTVDGQIRYQGAPAPQTILQYEGRLIQIRSANGIGVNVTLNSEALGALGARGEIVDRAYSLESVLAGTAVVPTQTIAVVESPTP